MNVPTGCVNTQQQVNHKYLANNKNKGKSAIRWSSANKNQREPPADCRLSGTAELIKDSVQSVNLLVPLVRNQKKDIPKSPIRAEVSSDCML